MSHYEATKISRRNHRIPAPSKSLDDVIAESIALVAITTLQRENPNLRGAELYDAVREHLQSGVIEHDDELAVFTAAYKLALPAYAGTVG